MLVALEGSPVAPPQTGKATARRTGTKRSK
jgi:hypothetical protein